MSRIYWIILLLSVCVNITVFLCIVCTSSRKYKRNIRRRNALLYTASFPHAAAPDLSVAFGRLDTLAYMYSERVCVVEKYRTLHASFRSSLATILSLLTSGNLWLRVTKIWFSHWKSVRVFNHPRQFTAKLNSPTKVTFKLSLKLKWSKWSAKLSFVIVIQSNCWANEKVLWVLKVHIPVPKILWWWFIKISSLSSCVVNSRDVKSF